MDNEQLYEQAVERAKNEISQDANRSYSLTRKNNDSRTLSVMHYNYVAGINDLLEEFAGLTSQSFEPLKRMYNP